jgi:hypothetical protein
MKCSSPVVDRYRAEGQTVGLPADVAFALPARYGALERRGVSYAIRLPVNDVQERAIEDLLTCPAADRAKPRLVQYRCFSYQAASCDPTATIAKIEHHLGEPFPRVGLRCTTTILYLWVRHLRDA